MVGGDSQIEGPMQGDNNVGDYISRAKAKVAAGRAEKDAQQRACRFANHTDEELV